MTLRDTLFWPLTLSYEAVTRVRGAAYNKGILAQRRLEGVVISVGNLTVGGTGKTPMVLWIAQRLLAEGKSVGILTRGYRGRPAAKETAKDGGEAASESSSDEVQMLKARLGERVAFGVGADRFARGKELSARGINWFVLDDGFQHRRLARNVDIVLVDATNPFGGGRLLPSGRLREPRSALSRADVVVITRSDRAPAIEAAVRLDSNAPIFYAKVGLDSICARKGDIPGESGDVQNAREQKLFAFCGIGNPAAFLADLRDWGLQIVGHKLFRDHHRYTQEDIQEIQEEAEKSGATSVICTEKDTFNLHGVRWQTGSVFYCRVSMQIDREEKFWRAILAKAKSRARTSR
jgi:tetraacyldisaccharide 4'-kinase